MDITVRIKYNYGVQAIYPVDELAKSFLELTGKRTFSRANLDSIRDLGFDIKVQQEEL